MVRSYPEGYKINFSELARCYGVKNNNSECPKNGGQIVKMFLEENGINFGSFNFKNKSDFHFRRKKINIAGINISIPTDITNTEIKTNLTKLINDGTYTIGDLIVPQKFEKLVLNADLTTTEIKEFEIAGCKVPLSEIRQKQYKKSNIFTGYLQKVKLKKCIGKR